MNADRPRRNDKVYLLEYSAAAEGQFVTTNDAIDIGCTGPFGFWNSPAEDIYTKDDGEPL